MPTSSRKEQHNTRQQREHAEAQKRKAERREAHERRMRLQAEQAAQVKADRARRHQALKDEETKRRREKERRKACEGRSTDSGSSAHSSWSGFEYRTASMSRSSAHAESVALYEAGWKRMKQCSAGGVPLRFSDIPWPTFQPIQSLLELSRSNIESFVLSDTFCQGKDKRTALREFILNWHPDKFIGRWVNLVNEAERSAVKEGVTLVACVFNELLASYGK